MNLSEPPHSHIISAAVGWLELGNPAEARAELDKLAAELRRHSDVLEVRWAICAAAQDWTEALTTARQLTEAAPGRASGWLHQAYALRRAAGHGLADAWEALRPVAERFPEELLIPYNLSCYACQMGKVEVARVWLKKAFELGNAKQLKKMALADPDLKPLWEEISAW